MREPVSTGLGDLDDLTGGLWPGALWVLSGPSGAGRTMLVTQLARQAAVVGRARTRLVSAREPASTVVRHLLAAQARVPLHHLLTGRLTDEDEQRLAPARDLLAAAPLDVDAADRQVDLATPDEVLADEAPDVLLVDDLDLWGPAPVTLLRRLRSHARDTAATVVVSVPHEVVMEGGTPNPLWARLPDVLLRVHRPELDDRGSPRAGEVDLVLLRHRTGPVATITCAFQGYYARTVDLPRRADG
jgi:replicative DNA helicase